MLTAAATVQLYIIPCYHDNGIYYTYKCGSFRGFSGWIFIAESWKFLIFVSFSAFYVLKFEGDFFKKLLDL